MNTSLLALLCVAALVVLYVAALIVEKLGKKSRFNRCMKEADNYQKQIDAILSQQKRGK